MRLEEGSRLGPYEIIGVIGAGGMGEVYRARDTRLGREVAIKVLPYQLTHDRERLARFEREARSASALNHRNIVTIHDFSSRDGEAWLVMELIRGESLRDVVSRGAVPMKRLVSIGAGVADGLAAAHEAGIVHRDLKPENVMIATDGTPKILDFGLVKQVLREDTNSPTEMRVTSSGMIMGTAGYMSPEQARGQHIDYRTDQFSLGLMLHEMATGEHPFRRPSGLETLNAILNEEPPPLGDEFPEPFAAIVERCLSKNPPERYGSTADLAHDLARLRDRSGPYVTISRRKPARRAWPAIALAALTIATLLALVTLITWRKPAAPPDSFQTAIATPDVVEVVRDEVTLPVALSPNGRHLIVFGIDADAIPTLTLHDLRSDTRRQIAQNAFSAGWSPDSKSIAFIADGKLKTMSIDGGPPRIICDARAEGTPAWNGNDILYVQYSVKEPGIYRVNASGGTPSRLLGPNKGVPGLPWWPSFLPDGKHFLYLKIFRARDLAIIEHELRVGSLDGGPSQKVPLDIDSRAEYANGHLLFVRDGSLIAQPFDPVKMRPTGEPQPLVDGIHYFRTTALAGFSASQNGVVAWRSSPRPSRIAWLDRNGTESKVIGKAIFSADGRLSRDGHRFAIGVVDPKQEVSDVWVYDLDRDTTERITFSLLDEKSPVWAADDHSIFYRSDGGGGPPDIFQWMPQAGESKLFYRGPGVEEPHDVSLDGKSMLFVDTRQLSSDIHVLPLVPSGPARPFVATQFREFSPRFSPDGKWVAYDSDLSGRPEIYVRPFEGSTTATKVSKDGGTRPRWRRDGKELFFLGPAGRLMSVAMNGGAAAGVPHMLFQSVDAVDFEPGVDGTRFIVQIEERTTEPPVRLLINWPQRLGLK